MPPRELVMPKTEKPARERFDFSQEVTAEGLEALMNYQPSPIQFRANCERWYTNELASRVVEPTPEPVVESKPEPEPSPAVAPDLPPLPPPPDAE